MEGMSFVNMFSMFFPRKILNLVIEQTNKKLRSQIVIGEFLRFIGILIFMHTVAFFVLAGCGARATLITQHGGTLGALWGCRLGSRGSPVR